MTYSNSQFTYNGPTQTFSAWASDLREVSDYFEIKIPGRVLGFEIAKTYSNSWEYTCTTGAFKARIFND